LSFEVKEKDLLARIGKLKTKSGTVETPLLFPVINPAIQTVAPSRMREQFGFEALITNAYILKKRLQHQTDGNDVHKILDFNGVVMTDSGAYQILVYGDIDVTPREIVSYQEKIDTDIATILDIPTGWDISEEHAEQTVQETLKRAKEFFTLKTRDDILWVGPVQGGRYLNLVAKSAGETGKLPFQIHALGSPTEVMERYRFDVLVDMIMTAKMNLPIERPLHLFGAGHPFMFSLATALGCDLFDSAAYAIYAKENRYMTETGTSRLNELEYFPCACPKCAGTNPKRVLELSREDRQVFLTEHNLYVCSAEIRRIKQAIKDGRLWEHLEARAHSHPALLEAVKKLDNYKEFIEKHSPSVKKSGLFFLNSMALMRPEVIHYRKNLAERYSKPKETKLLVLVPQSRMKPFQKSHDFKRIKRLLQKQFRKQLKEVHVCFYAAPFGVVPAELDEMYPLSQHETALPLDKETVDYVAEQVADYIKRTNYQTVILINDSETWRKAILDACRKTCRRKKKPFKSIDISKLGTAKALVHSKRLDQEQTKSPIYK
jgi:7-cyano-7-deazaguanine tRNA-ribosyltransferase